MNKQNEVSIPKKIQVKYIEGQDKVVVFNWHQLESEALRHYIKIIMGDKEVEDEL